MVYENILEEIESRQELLCALNDYIWDPPEIAFQEEKASGRIAEILEVEYASTENVALQSSFLERTLIMKIIYMYFGDKKMGNEAGNR